MRYERIYEAIFLERPNRFIAKVMLRGQEEICHVKNTGRCRELLVPGCVVYVQDCGNPNRKTRYDLIAVRKGERIINMDSQAPNKAAGEFIGKLFPDATVIRPETVFGASRFDYYVETPNKRIFMEVKGVTLEEDGAVFFPDAPTERGVKHLHELIECRRAGYEAYILFVIQMADVVCFAPNDKTHPAFGDALRWAFAEGVKILAVECDVTSDSMVITKRVPIRLEKGEENETNS